MKFPSINTKGGPCVNIADDGDHWRRHLFPYKRLKDLLDMTQTHPRLNELIIQWILDNRSFIRDEISKTFKKFYINDEEGETPYSPRYFRFSALLNQLEESFVTCKFSDLLK